MIKPASLLVTLVLLVMACNNAGTSPTPVATTAAPTSTAVATTAAPSVSPSPSPAAPSGSTGPASPSPSPSPTPPPGAVEGELTIWADETRVEVFTALGQQFTEQYGVPVHVYQFGSGDIRTQMVAVAPLNEGPDIFVGAHDWLGQLVEAGVVEPFDIGQKANLIEQVGLDAMSYGGQLYGLPYAWEAIALYYNKDLSPEPPATWDELKTKAKELQDAGTVTQGYLFVNKDPYHSYPILSGMGGYIFGKNADGSYNPADVGLDSAGGKAYAEELASMTDEGLLNPDIGPDQAKDLMLTGKAAYWFSGPWFLPDFRKARDEQGLNYGVAQIPMMEQQPRPFVGVQGIMVNAFAPNKLRAQTFLTEFVATDDAMASLFEADPRMPTWKATAQRLDDEDLKQFVQSASHGDPMPAIPEMNKVWESWTNAIDFILRGQVEPDQAVTDAATQIRTLIGQ